MDERKSVGFMIKLINESMEKKSNKALKQFDITFSQGKVLSYLHRRSGLKTSQKDIEDHLQVSHPTVVGILKRLEIKGLITTEFDVEDKRTKNIYLTSKEEILYKEIMELRKSMEEKLFDGLSSDEVEQLVYMLNVIYHNIQK